MWLSSVTARQMDTKKIICYNRNMKPLSLKQYIKTTIDQKAKIGYGRDVKQWYGILDHTTGLICSQRKTKAEVKKKLAEILEEFIVLDIKDRQKEKYNEIKAPQIPRAYIQA